MFPITSLGVIIRCNVGCNVALPGVCGTLLFAPESRLGSIELDIDPALGMPVAAQLAVDGAISDLPIIHLDEEFLSPSMATMEMAPLFRAATLGEPFVAIQNLESHPQTVTVQCVSAVKAETKQLLLEGTETRLIRPCAQTDSPLGSLDALKVSNEATQPYGLSIAGAMPGSELAVFGFSVRGNDFEHLLTSVNFSDIRRIKSAEWVFAGVPVGNSSMLVGSFEPHATVTNFSATPANVFVVYSSPQSLDSAPRILSTLAVPPGTSAALKLPRLPDAALDSTL